MSHDPRRRVVECPFLVLDLPVDASRAEVERTARRLLDEIALGRDSARTYWTPLGRRARSDELVRVAAAQLRDPRARVVHEVVARAAQGRSRDDASEPAPIDPAWRDAFATLALGRRGG